jgi:regulator of PEP synthase PpsR (kinase-PPPase family)
MTITSVYLVYNEWSAANYKVGMTNSSPRRIGQILDEYGVEPKLITRAWFTTKKAAKTAEKLWHKFLSQFQTSDVDQVQRFADWANSGATYNDLSHWLYFQGASDSDSDAYDDRLIKAIPRSYTPPRRTIDVWRNQTTYTNDS